MAAKPTITIIRGRTAGHSNAIINGFRYTNDRKRGSKTYMKCVLYCQGCRARITLMNRGLITSAPDHPTHDVQYSETYIHVSKRSLKTNAAQTDHPTKRLVAQAVSGMNFETRPKLNCQIYSLGKMVRQSRGIAHSYPIRSRILEDISLPANYIHSSSGTTVTHQSYAVPSSLGHLPTPRNSWTRATSSSMVPSRVHRNSSRRC